MAAAATAAIALVAAHGKNGGAAVPRYGALVVANVQTILVTAAAVIHAAVHSSGDFPRKKKKSEELLCTPGVPHRRLGLPNIEDDGCYIGNSKVGTMEQDTL
ncbi:unnamed protein product [Linum tenue]|uniref:Uncharacterized protein n=1 Tax=Linum tenue TaxID=586396 RepID=A0AAV0HUE1_9ROSI|nr:unnamed protein product [Linum tenue]